MYSYVLVQVWAPIDDCKLTRVNEWVYMSLTWHFEEARGVVNYFLIRLTFVHRWEGNTLWHYQLAVLMWYVPAHSVRTSDLGRALSHPLTNPWCIRLHRTHSISSSSISVTPCSSRASYKPTNALRRERKLWQIPWTSPEIAWFPGRLREPCRR